MESESFFGQETINRVSFLREDADYIQKTVEFSGTRLLFIKDNFPLIKPLNDGKSKPEFLDFKISEIEKIHDYLKKWSVLNKEQSIELRQFPNIVFLGLMTPKNDSKEEVLKHKDGRYSGIPYFMIDITPSKTNVSDIKAPELDIFETLNSNNVEFDNLNDRSQVFKMSNADASLLAYGKMFIDWLNKQNFCPQCGKPVIKIHAGTKLKCSSNVASTTVVNGKEKTTYECESKNMSVSNIQFPRTDPVCIIATVNFEHKKILLANGLKFPSKRFYSCVAGFMEPGESVETCCLREIWEETGVKCSKVVMLQSQPWPFPVNLMIGCIGVVEFNGENEVIDLGHDPELNDAKWFDFEEVREVLKRQKDQYTSTTDKNNDEKSILLPPPTAIAHTLIDMIVSGRFPKL